MRLFLIENFTNEEFDIYKEPHREQLIQFAKENCSQAINEFFKTGHYLYRGMHNLHGDHAYSVNTKGKRESLGAALSGKTGPSFNSWLAKNGHARRDKKAAFATSSTPEEYRGVNTSEWYYMLPIGDYHYTYINDEDGGDFNFSRKVKESLMLITEMERDINNIESNATESILSFRLFKRSNDQYDFENMVFLKPLEDKFDELCKKLYKYVMDIAMVFQKGVFQENNLEAFEELVTSMVSDYQAWNKEFNAMSNKASRKSDGNDDEKNVLYWFTDNVYNVTSVVDRIRRDLENEPFRKIVSLMDSLVSNTITENFKGNEIVFNCDKYLLIPYKGDGSDIIKAII